MTGPEHYRAAEELAGKAAVGEDGYNVDYDPVERGLFLAEALVHALLAVVAAKAVASGTASPGDGDGVPAGGLGVGGEPAGPPGTAPTM